MENSEDSLNEVQKAYLRMTTIPVHIEKLSNKYLIDIEENITEPPISMSIVKDGKQTIIASQGNLSLIIGKAKSRKSTFLQLLASIFINNTTSFFSIGYKHKDYQVIYFDTEQAKFHCWRAAVRILRACGLEKPIFKKRFLMYALRGADIKERFNIIKEVLDNSDLDAGAVIIDGIKDLLYSVNDEEGATFIVNYLMGAAERLNTHIYVVLHQNKNDFNARGHIGTELVNKSETTISLTKSSNDDISIVKCEYSRNMPFDEFAIGLENDLPVIIDSYIPKSSRSNHKSITDPSNLEDNEHRRVLHTALKNKRPLTYNELLRILKLEFINIGTKVGDTKLRQYIAYYTEKGFIINKSINPRKAEYILANISDE